jgi:hypothetical protein
MSEGNGKSKNDKASSVAFCANMWVLHYNTQTKDSVAKEVSVRSLKAVEGPSASGEVLKKVREEFDLLVARKLAEIKLAEDKENKNVELQQGKEKKTADAAKKKADKQQKAVEKKEKEVAEREEKKKEKETEQENQKRGGKGKKKMQGVPAEETKENAKEKKEEQKADDDDDIIAITVTEKGRAVAGRKKRGRNYKGGNSEEEEEENDEEDMKDEEEEDEEEDEESGEEEEEEKSMQEKKVSGRKGANIAAAATGRAVGNQGRQASKRARKMVADTHCQKEKVVEIGASGADFKKFLEDTVAGLERRAAEEREKAEKKAIEQQQKATKDQERALEVIISKQTEAMQALSARLAAYENIEKKRTEKAVAAKVGTGGNAKKGLKRKAAVDVREDSENEEEEEEEEEEETHSVKQGVNKRAALMPVGNQKALTQKKASMAKGAREHMQENVDDDDDMPLSANYTRQKITENINFSAFTSAVSAANKNIHLAYALNALTNTVGRLLN